VNNFLSRDSILFKGSHQMFRPMNQRLLSLQSSRDAATLVEILVATAIGVVILATLAGIFETSNSIARRSITQDRLFSEAVAITSDIERSLQHRIPSPGEETWQADQIAFITNQNTSSGKIRILSDDKTKAVAMENLAGDGSPMKVLGMERDDMAAQVRFEFASEMNGLDPQWVQTLPQGAPPRLVRYEVTVQPLQRNRDQPVMPVHLTGAVALVD